MGYINGKKVLQVLQTEHILSVDDELSTTSENPVQNKVVTQALNGKVDKVEGKGLSTNDFTDALKSKVEEVDNKANTSDLENGGIVVAKALETKSIENVSEESGSTQDDPFIHQGTGTNNNTSETPTSPVAKQLEKQGNTVCVNMLLNKANYPATTEVNGITFTNNGDGSYTLSGIASATASFSLVTINVIAGHKYLILGGKSSSVYCVLSGASNWTGSRFDYGNGGIAVASISFGTNMIIEVANGTDLTTPVTVKPIFSNLTQWFGSNDLIPQDLLDHPETWGNYDNTNRAYNVGSLENSNGRYLETIGFNQLNPDTHKAQLIGGYEYEIVGNYTSVAYSTGETITIVNGKFMPLANGELTVTGDDDTTCIHLVWDGERDGEYQPFVKKVYDTGTEVLRSAGSVRDTKAPDGTITRRIGSRAYQSGDESDNTVWTDLTNTYYILETPTTEQGTPFSENIEVDDYGTMAWKDSDDEFVEIPQGCKIFYPVDYVLLVDDLNNYVDGDVTNLAKKSDLASDKAELQGVDSQLLNAIGGTLRQCLCVKETLDLDNTDFVEIGSLSPITYSGDGIFNLGTISGAKAPADNNTLAKMLCSKYKASIFGTGNQANLTISLRDNGVAYIKDTTYTDATAFKNAMKGVLLAYEKAN